MTTRGGVENITILESAPYDSKRSLQDIEACHTSASILDDLESSGLYDGRNLKS